MRLIDLMKELNRVAEAGNWNLPVVVEVKLSDFNLANQSLQVPSRVALEYENNGCPHGEETSEGAGRRVVNIHLGGVAECQHGELDGAS